MTTPHLRSEDQELSPLVPQDVRGAPDELQLLRQIVHESADCIKVLDMDAHLLGMNAGGQRVMEVDNFSVCERALWPTLWPEATQPEVLAALAAAREGRTGRFSGFCPTLKGTPKWWDVTVSPVRDGNGRVARLLAISRDITRQKQDEERLRGSEAHFRRLADANPIGVVIGHTDGTLPYVNDAYLRLIGVTREDFEAGTVNWQAITPPEWLRADEIAIEQVRERGYSDPYEKENVLPDGTRRPILMALARASLQDASLIAYVLDLTDRKAVERALSDENAQLQAFTQQLLDSAGEGIFGMDLQGKTTFANPAALAMTGFTLDEMLGRTQHALLKHVNGDGQVHQVDGEVFWRKDGTSFPVECVATPLRNFRGEVEGSVVTFKDITARKQAEEALRRTNEELRRSNRDLEQFAFVAAHDLQEPLRTIVSYAELLERKHGDQMHGGARRYLSFITGGTNRMKVLVDDLLTYASLNVTPSTRGPVPLDRAWQAALEALNASLEAADAGVQTEPLPTVLGDTRQLTQVLQNLIGNAVKFRQPGVPPAVRLTASREGDMWHFRLSDNGIGMEEAYLERIFNMFQRLHTRDRFEGTGLGLSICQKVIEGHGGRIWAESRVHEGSTFHFTLRAAETA